MVSFSQCLYGQSVAAFCGKGKNKNTASSDRRRGGAPDLYSSGAHNADALLDVISVLDLIDHGNGIVCIGDNGLSAVIEDKLLAALQVLPGPLSVRLEIPGGADGSPLMEVHFTSCLSRSSPRAFAIAAARGLKASGKSFPRETVAVCAGST